MSAAPVILITGFGPFPGMPFNPTGALAQRLANIRRPAFAPVRRVAHVFETSYEAVDRELPALLDLYRPRALLMFGVAGRTRHIRIETRARNRRTTLLADVSGDRAGGVIEPGGASALTLPAPAQKLLAAARATGLPVALSRDAGRYLCNYLCWRAAELAGADRGDGAPLALAAFVHVPKPRPGGFDADDLARAGEAILRALVTLR